MRILLPLLLLALALPGCRRAAAPVPRHPEVAVTTSYLEAVSRDLVGDALAVVRLAEPGTCPGHFDLRPSQVTELRQCRVLLRFDFQRPLETKLADHAGAGPRVAAISVPGGLGCPDNYLETCRQTSAHLVGSGLLSQAHADARLPAVAARLKALSAALTNRVREAGLGGCPVIASVHQRDFCEWLGLRVAATFRAADAAGIQEIEDAIGAGQAADVRLVIANLPEGRRTADALAGRLGSRVVVFGNFPALHEGTLSFDAMVRANVDALVRTAVR